MKETHPVNPDDMFDWIHAEHLLNFDKKVRRKSTGLILNPSQNWHVSEEDKQATDWQLVPLASKEYK